MPKTLETLSLQEAKGVLAAGEAKAEQIGIPYNIAVVSTIHVGLRAHFCIRWRIADHLFPLANPRRIPNGSKLPELAGEALEV